MVPGLPQGRELPRSTYPRNEPITYHLSLSPLREPGVFGSLPFTLATLLVIPIPNYSCLNRPTTTRLTTRGFGPATVAPFSEQIQSLLGLIGEGPAGR